MRILILGAGALGGYFGARLLAAGRDATFLVRESTRQALSTHGLQVRSPHGDLQIPNPPTITTPAEPYDLILLTCKSWDLPSAIEAITPAVGPGTFILPLLNGMAHLAVLDRHFGPARVLGGLSNISATRSAEGVIHHLNPLHTLYFGDRAPGLELAPIAAALHHANFADDLRPDILQDMWNKWVTIATAAGSTCLLRGTMGDIVAANAVPILRAIMDEAVAIATAEGYATPQPAREEILAKFVVPGSPFTASMLRDLELGSRVERQQIFGELLNLAQQHHIPTPTLSIVNAHLSTYESRRTRQRGNG